MLSNCGVEEDFWESLKEIKPVHPKGNQSWIFTGRTDAEAETPILWSSDGKNWLICTDPDAVKDWRWEEKGMTEDEMNGWHHWQDGYELEKALGVGNGQGSMACCSPWGCKESDTSERLNWTELIVYDQQYSVCGQITLIFTHSNLFKVREWEGKLLVWSRIQTRLDLHLAYIS